MSLRAGHYLLLEPEMFADASLTSHDQHPAATVRAIDQFIENASLALPPYQGRRLHADIVSGSEEPV
jgi:hypothetical protein